MSAAKIYSRFRKIAFAEGVSLIILLFIAMPLKYIAGIPMATMIVGSIHGGLFVLFMFFAWELRADFGKPWIWFGKATLASFIPFGTFYMDKEWKREQLQLSENA